jgi:hypothetical protein
VLLRCFGLGVQLLNLGRDRFIRLAGKGFSHRKGKQQREQNKRRPARPCFDTVHPHRTQL